MVDAIQTRSIDQLPNATSVSFDMQLAVQPPDGETQKIDIEYLLSNMAKTDVLFETRAALEADLDHPDKTLALVWSDPDPTKSGYYVKIGSEGDGAWFITNLGRGWPSESDPGLRGELSGPTGGSILGWIQSGIGAVVRSILNKLRDTVNARDFGAIGDGVANDTAALQKALSSGAKRIIARAGDVYRITQPLVLDTNNVELDFQGATINLDDATGLMDHLQVGNGVTQQFGIKIKNTTFTRSQAATAGYAINMNYVGVVEVSGNRIFGNNRIWRGINVQRGIMINILNNYIDNYIDEGIFFEGTGLGGNRTVDVSIYVNRIEGGVRALSFGDFVEGVYCRHNIFYNTSGSCVNVEASSEETGLYSFKFQNNDFDTAGGSGLYLQNVNNVQVTDNWFASLVLDALQIKFGCQSLVVTDNQIYPTAAGMRIECDDVLASGNLISGGAVGIIVTPEAENLVITNNLFAYQSTIGVDLNSNPNIQLSNNRFASVSGTIIANAPTTGGFITNNSGDPTRGSSLAITVGASPYTYTAGARPEWISIYGGIVSLVETGGATIGTSSPSSIMLQPGKSVRVTHSATPSMVRVFQ